MNNLLFEGSTAMSRSILSLPPEQLTPFDLDALIAHAEALNEQNRQTFTTPFPKASSRWLSHYDFTPYPIAFTSQGAVDGGLSWLIGSTLDLSFTRSLCATAYGARGGSCYDPASLVFLEVAAKVDQYVDYAQFCPICTTATRDDATGNSPVCTAPLRTRTICATSATA